MMLRTAKAARVHQEDDTRRHRPRAMPREEVIVRLVVPVLVPVVVPILYDCVPCRGCRRWRWSRRRVLAIGERSCEADEQAKHTSYLTAHEHRIHQSVDEAGCQST